VGKRFIPPIVQITLLISQPTEALLTDPPTDACMTGRLAGLQDYSMTWEGIVMHNERTVSTHLFISNCACSAAPCLNVPITVTGLIGQEAAGNVRVGCGGVGLSASKSRGHGVRLANNSAKKDTELRWARDAC